MATKTTIAEHKSLVSAEDDIIKNGKTEKNVLVVEIVLLLRTKILKDSVGRFEYEGFSLCY